ncbi:hypothetical protein SDC9_103880 [bioreactor metagenome]|uniref:Uncharacterized protein n=1 Tax=bioreactor metagenome TaxID=1076179 RepID=A0A645AUZ0_9ZZZZ
MFIFPPTKKPVRTTVNTTEITTTKYCQESMPTTSLSGMYNKPKPTINGKVKLPETNLYSCFEPFSTSLGNRLKYLMLAAIRIIRTGPGKPVSLSKSPPAINSVQAVNTPAPINLMSNGLLSSCMASAISASPPNLINWPLPLFSGYFSPRRFKMPEQMIAKKLPMMVAGINCPTNSPLGIPVMAL